MHSICLFPEKYRARLLGVRDEADRRKVQLNVEGTSMGR